MRGKGKRGRHLARYVSIFLLSGGYTLPSLLPVYAADVTVPEVVVDASHPAVTMSEPGPINKKTTPTPPHREPNRNAVVGNAADLPLAGDVRNVVGNKLTIRATSAATMAGILNLYAGRTYGTGNANGNVLTVDGFFSFPPLVPNPASTSTNPLPGYATLLYGGYSEHGNADGNTIIIKDVVDPNAFSPNPWAYNKVGVGGLQFPTVERSTPVMRRMGRRRTTVSSSTMRRRSAMWRYTAAAIPFLFTVQAMIIVWRKMSCR